MKKIVIIGLILSFLIGCDKEDKTIDNFYIAEIVGYDLNCATCLLYFPDCTQKKYKFIGESESCLYNSINLNQADFKIGELLQVKVRIAEANELNPCKTLYPTTNYTSVYVSEYSKHQNTLSIDTLELKYEEYATTFGQSTLRFDSVLNDSRCPEGGICVWEGNAKIKLNLSIIGIGEHSIELNTNKSISIDTTINHLNISLINLSPYPNISLTIKPKDYTVKLSITNLTTIVSNSQILSFNPDKDACSWGWKIRMGNDTIKSDDVLIGKTVGYEIAEPINVYIQLGEKERSCSELVGLNYYKIKRIIKINN
ncbi:MAG TPA: hypothetical protein VJY41_08595 [Prolixibacteraceae bacterium]|nr:hypothetical protein [Prolixibacteraceae bacterium]